MIKKTITYTNYDNKEVTEDLYFHLTQKEVLGMEIENDEKLSARLTRIQGALSKYEKTPDKTPNALLKEFISIFDDIIATAYGTRVVLEDGTTTFIKSKKEYAKERFLESLQYDTIFTDALSNPTGMAAFLQSLMPNANNPIAKKGTKAKS